MAWLQRIRNALRPGRLERDIDRELSFHVAERADELRAEGMPDEEALRRARRQIGNMTLQAERTRDADISASLDRLAREVRFAIRTLARAPGFTAVVVSTLGVAIGATTAIFSVVSGILIQPLPFPSPDRLVALVHSAPGVPGPGNENIAASPALYFTYRDHNRTFESVALWFSSTASILGAGEPEEVPALRATHELLPTLRVQPALGRAFSQGDDQPGSPRTVILSYGYWQRRFGGAGDVIGRTLTVDGLPHEIVGVLPLRFRFFQQPADVLTPMQLNRARALTGPIGERGIARLKDGVTLDEAKADARRMMPIMVETFPLVGGFSRQRFDSSRFGPNFKPLKESIVGDLDDVLWVLMGTIAILLLIACANVANLQLVRTDGRTQELAIQAALGASRGAILRSLLLESTLLGLAGGAVGLVLAYASLPALLSMAAAQLPSALDVTIDARVLFFALSTSAVSGMLFGLLPAVKYAGPQVVAMIRDVGRSYSASRERHGTRSSLVVAQVALALVLLVASGLMIRTFQSLRDVEPGFDAPEQVQVVRLEIPQGSVREFDRVIRMQNDIEDRLSAIPGVESVGFSSRLPLSRSGPSGPFSFEDKPGAEALGIEFRYVSPGLFKALGTPLVAGRAVEWADSYQKRQVAVISESLARREWGSPAAALGKRMRRPPNQPWLEIVGVVGDVRHDGLEQPAPDTVYLASSEVFAPFAARTTYYFVRSAQAGTAGLLADVAKAVWSVNNSLPLGAVQTLGDLYDRSMARTSLTLVMLAITASMALLLGLIGVYAVVSYTVAQRTREIGIRMALGAPHAALKRMFLEQGLRAVILGVVLGLGAAVALARLMESLLFGVAPLDPSTYLTVSASFVGAAAITIYLPIRRLLRVDPMQLCLRDST